MERADWDGLPRLVECVYDGGSGGRCGSYERIRVDRLVKREVG